MKDDGRQAQLRALQRGNAFVAHERTRVTRLHGSDARAWLQDLVTAGVEDLEPFGSRRSLLLTPTGRIQADFHVLASPGGSFLLVQPDDQPVLLAEALGRYVLSSDVHLDPSPLVSVTVIDGGAEDAGRNRWRPSMLGVGYDLLVPAGESLRVLREQLTADDLVEIGPAAVESWRIHAGRPRFPVDLDEDSLPAEAALDDGVLIDRTKGCFLGQESVAKVRNLGHPARTVLALRASAPVVPGEIVLAGHAEQVGIATSADTLDGRTSVIARLRWATPMDDLRTATGAQLGRS